MSYGRLARVAWRTRKAALYRAPAPTRRRPLELPADLLPSKVNGKWRAPRVSARHRARLRKEALLAGMYGSYEPGVGECAVPGCPRDRRWRVRGASGAGWRGGCGCCRACARCTSPHACTRARWFAEAGGWDPAWDKPNKTLVMKPPKGRKHDNTQHLRCVQMWARARRSRGEPRTSCCSHPCVCVCVCARVSVCGGAGSLRSRRAWKSRSRRLPPTRR